ncbi:hypothetical protein BLNAU_7064 [Blattamonas nauphoetae]|uniref:Uncharacterized protein n=1 Tax=Blattamonas nauphoetae TaxID=2049346 RepID=A0ABQ9Y2C1_9EUKA|nr:hypothetical protein BLNAU_7064 [Blattamonas nauphoetae]
MQIEQEMINRHTLLQRFSNQKQISSKHCCVVCKSLQLTNEQYWITRDADPDSENDTLPPKQCVFDDEQEVNDYDDKFSDDVLESVKNTAEPAGDCVWIDSAPQFKIRVIPKLCRAKIVVTEGCDS